ncbi:penicillin-binding protein [Streptomyces sp. Ru73]|uniref:penicillin-binding transpeptidase domain-containing protein n=1 Tax=Streptomyces sp. Ru73 TaxID=2080748 RepID=UPI000CDD9809|nr:penicillin-binding transpeptidase domain-containing protein [Streptomyces sp. Ru73]POX42552.1 penicillin-binding protein [Streptomyces sp. Ru73]
MRSGVKITLVGGVLTVVTGGALYCGYNLVHGIMGYGGTGGTAQAAPVRTGPPSADETTETAEAFLAAWAKGESTAAAALTDNRAVARTELAGFHDQAHLSHVVITPGERKGTTVPYTVKAEVSYDGRSAPLSYASELRIVRGRTTHKPLVDWRPSVLHPELEEGEYLVTGAAEDPEIRAVDHRGRPLTKERYPSLGPVLDELREKYGKQAGGTRGVELRIENEEGEPGRTLLTLRKGRAGTLHTTLDADVQAAAERAVQAYPESSVVAVRPSTGEIRAVANNRTDGYNAAMLGRVAPGSTMKIVTAAMMIENGVGDAAGKAACPPTVSWEGYTFHNLDDFSIPDGTLTDAFAQSCNTAFIKAVKPLNDRGAAGTALGRTARDSFGLGADWHTGVPSFDGSVPESSGVETAASYIGQGKVQMSPLAMASVTATVVNGGFRQPVLVPRSLDDRALATARPLSPATARQLRQMMHAATVGRGTAVAAMAGVGGNKGAKTGSAEKDGQTRSNSWFTGYSDDLAAAALVQSGGHGGDAAGPVVAQVLRAG